MKGQRRLTYLCSSLREPALTITHFILFLPVILLILPTVQTQMNSHNFEKLNNTINKTRETKNEKNSNFNNDLSQKRYNYLKNDINTVSTYQDLLNRFRRKYNVETEKENNSEETYHVILNNSYNKETNSDNLLLNDTILAKDIKTEIYQIDYNDIDNFPATEVTSNIVNADYKKTTIREIRQSRKIGHIKDETMGKLKIDDETQSKLFYDYSSTFNRSSDVYDKKISNNCSEIYPNELSDDIFKFEDKNETEPDLFTRVNDSLDHPADLTHPLIKNIPESTKPDNDGE
ncbi:unnamed protein product [Euphydryas editha]|uniref:Uncharacterized protein n=1 Tax=Euphydryas editha TaxID=104508 RepID=A0AAU9V9E4_EUPED|nr:unnamed protein product [Euphydryas editha]